VLDMVTRSLIKVVIIAFLNLTSYKFSWTTGRWGGGGGGGYFDNFWVGCAAGTLEPSAYTRASSAEFCYPILE